LDHEFYVHVVCETIREAYDYADNKAQNLVLRCPVALNQEVKDDVVGVCSQSLSSYLQRLKRQLVNLVVAVVLSRSHEQHPEKQQQ
jgi:hypothetical protein